MPAATRDDDWNKHFRSGAVGLGNFSAQAPSDRWTVEGKIAGDDELQDKQPTIKIKRLPDFGDQEPPTYRYCRLKITVIPSNKNYPITEELELGSGEGHNEVEALTTPRPQNSYTGSEAN